MTKPTALLIAACLLAGAAIGIGLLDILSAPRPPLTRDACLALRSQFDDLPNLAAQQLAEFRECQVLYGEQVK